MALNVPPIGTRGLYSLKAPFTTVPNELYTCAAVRFFKDVEDQGIDVFKRYYLPFDISQDTYRQDQAAGVVIVTLMSDTHAPLYVPSSFITAFPTLDSIKYHHVVLSLSLGALPEHLDLTFLKDQIAGITSDVIGVAPEVFENVAAITGAVSPEEHDAIEAARQAAITHRTTDYAKVIELQARNATLEQKLTILENIVVEAGLLT